jgi:threonine/homoserine/homoserine lactone efflux protein
MDFFAFLLTVLLLELTPGPNMAYLASLALSRGRGAGLIATAGVACGLAVHAMVAGLGAGVLIQQYSLLYEGALGRGGLSALPGMGGLAY